MCRLMEGLPARFAERLRQVLPPPEFFVLSINGKWLTFGPLLAVMLIDLSCAHGQLLYEPQLYGQYADPGDSRIWVICDTKYLEEAYELGELRGDKSEMITYGARRNLTTGEPLNPSAATDYVLASRYQVDAKRGSAKWAGLLLAIFWIVLFLTVLRAALWRRTNVEEDTMCRSWSASMQRSRENLEYNVGSDEVEADAQVEKNVDKHLEAPIKSIAEEA